MLIETRSAPMTRVLSKAQADNSQSLYFSSFQTVTADPHDVNPFPALAPAFWFGGEGLVAPNKIQVFPFAKGEPFVEFYSRIYGWRRLGNKGDQFQVWIPYLLLEYFSICCNQPGQYGGLIGSTEYLCDTIVVTNGTVGSGYVDSPGNNLPGYIVLDLQGCQEFQFDFVAGEEFPAFPNALWSPL